MKRPRLKFSVLVSFIILVSQGCVHEPLVPQNPGPEPGPVTDETCDPAVVYFQSEILPLLISNCAKGGCHDAATAEDGIILDSYANVMNSDVIEAGDPSDSELYEQITEDEPDEIMPPPPAEPLSSQQVAVIRSWILQGAKNT
ncbi:MAG TPA: c-type cytochrome domain-containing protein, partial [Chryseosolibacter sp.]|nr:c-type cytochrome domain-containing protein [Chryseosolibacter sp.]